MRKELHEMIDNADDAKLKAMHLLLNGAGSTAYTDEEIRKFYSILEQHERGALELATMEEVHGGIRSKLNARK